MIAPHGGTLINRIVEGKERDALLENAPALPRIELDAWAISDVEMIGIGGFSPLEGFMTKADYESVVNTRRLANGLVWTIPVTLAVDEATAGRLKAKHDVSLTSHGSVVAVLHL
ncbi:MAG TPA: sulfate adenylyltransferase, partial [Candidatus Omnitrophica bacterium]|nr:sulfate adenylyltransferase [Candidatus Omnitrophota bacterium]